MAVYFNRLSTKLVQSLLSTITLISFFVKITKYYFHVWQGGGGNVGIETARGDFTKDSLDLPPPKLLRGFLKTPTYDFPVNFVLYFIPRWCQCTSKG